MAETTDRPQGAPEVSSVEPGAVAPAAEGYRPLSLLALAGFGVAVLYAVVVLGGGAVALYNRVPWLMPTWTFLVPAAALVLCGLAWLSIRNAEGTLSGLAFTTWGIRLTVVVALSYAAYYTFTFFAVRLQAMDCAEKFVEQIKQGKLARAYLIAAGDSSRDLDDAQARAEVEGRFNNPQSLHGMGGQFTMFCRNPMVRGIQSAGDEVRFVPQGVHDWDYEQGGYRVKVRYQVVSPLSEFEILVDTFGRDSQSGESKGRQWKVRLQGGDTHAIAGSMKLTPLGEERQAAMTTAQAFGRAWQDKINRHRWDEVYLDTLPPDERAALRKGQATARLQGTAPVAGPAALALAEPGRDVRESGLRTLAEGQLLRLDEKTFWTPRREREAILRQIHETFRPGGGGEPRFSLSLPAAAAPLSRAEAGRLTFLLDAELSYRDERTSQPRYVVEGFLIVSADEGRARISPTAWKVDGVELSSGRTPPEPRPGQPGQAPGQ